MSEKAIPVKVKVFFIVLVVFMPIFLIGSVVYYHNKGKSEPLDDGYRVQLLKPVGQVVRASEADKAAVSAAPAVAFSAENVHKTVCSTCHDTGLLGAPKTHDDAAWNERIAEAGSIEEVIKIGIQGLNSMPPKGGASITDEQFAEVVHYISGK